MVRKLRCSREARGKKSSIWRHEVNMPLQTTSWPRNFERTLPTSPSFTTARWLTSSGNGMESPLRLLKSVATGDREDANYQALLSSVLTRLGRYREALPAS